MAKKKITISVEDKLKSLYTLQSVDSAIDQLRIVRGALPMEIEDLQDEIIKLESRVSGLEEEKSQMKDNIKERKEAIKNAKELIKKYTKQLENIKNNREFTSLTKEVEYQELDIELSEKQINEFKSRIKMKEESIKSYAETLIDYNSELDIKNSELNEIVSETEKEEKKLTKKSVSAQKMIDDRLLLSYNKIRSNVVNGLALVSVDRDACGGCFNKIPPQRQLDIKLHKKIIVCEHCGRILVDSNILSNKTS